VQSLFVALAVRGAKASLLMAAILFGSCTPQGVERARQILTDRPAPPSAGTVASNAEDSPAPGSAIPGTDPTPSKAQFESPWRPLANDGLHDPTNPALGLLQEPEEALSVLPPAQEGNNVDWVAALSSGAIAPRTNIHPETKIKVIDLDIIFPDTAGQPMVRFPHKQHTEWLDCSNCHDKLFVAKKGANDISMFKILQGQFCGQCHGAVSFPLTQCARCHSVPRPHTSRTGPTTAGRP